MKCKLRKDRKRGWVRDPLSVASLNLHNTSNKIKKINKYIQIILISKRKNLLIAMSVHDERVHNLLFCSPVYESGQFLREPLSSFDNWVQQLLSRSYFRSVRDLALEHFFA